MEDLIKKLLALLKKQSKKTNMGKMSRIKGSNFERYIAKELSLVLYGDETTLRRTPLSGGWGAKYAQGDIAGNDSFKFLIECRNRENWKTKDLFNRKSILYKWFDVIDKQAKPLNKYPVLIFTQNFEEVYVMYKYSDLMFRGGELPHIKIPSANGIGVDDLYITIFTDFITLLRASSTIVVKKSADFIAQLVHPVKSIKNPKEMIGDDGELEWVCKHGVGHPYSSDPIKSIHTCDGCCGLKIKKGGNKDE